MDIFLDLSIKIIPLYLVIAFGYLAGKYYNVAKESIAALTIYIISPAIILLGTLEAGLNLNVLILPAIYYFIGILVCLFTLVFFGKFFDNKTKSLLAVVSSLGNTGFFGIPIATVILGEDALPIAVMITFGNILFTNSVGFYLLARSKDSVKESLIKLLKLPSLYAFLIGILVNVFALHFPNFLTETLNILKGGYSSLGMMLIGIGLVGSKFVDFDWKFILFSILNKFGIWIIFIFCIVFLDMNYWHFFNDLIYKVLILFAFVPIGSNGVALASKFNVYPEKAAISVLISTTLAMVLIPLIASFIMSNRF